MLDRNETPFAAIAFEHVHRDGQSMAVLAARGAFRIHDRQLVLSEHQEINLADVYVDVNGSRLLLHATDLIPFKEAGDLTVLANSHAPSASQRNWPVSIRVDSGLDVRIQVHRERFYDPEKNTYFYSDCSGERSYTTSIVPMIQSNAFGGNAVGNPYSDICFYNTIGKGYCPPGLARNGEPVAAHQIEYIPPSGYEDLFRYPIWLNPVPPNSRYRFQYAGTYDQAWLSQRSPLLPADFRYKFYQYAHPALQKANYFSAGDRIEFRGLSHDGRAIEMEVPAIGLIGRFQWTDGREVQVGLTLDGIAFDIRDPVAPAVELTWRAWVPICARFLKVDLVSVDPGTFASSLVSTHHGVAER